MTNLSTIAELRRTALDAVHGFSPTDQLAPLWAALRGQEVADRLAILDRDAARRAAEEVRDALRALHPSASPANSGSA